MNPGSVQFRVLEQDLTVLRENCHQTFKVAKIKIKIGLCSQDAFKEGVGSALSRYKKGGPETRSYGSPAKFMEIGCNSLIVWEKWNLYMLRSILVTPYQG